MVAACIVKNGSQANLIRCEWWARSERSSLLHPNARVNGVRALYRRGFVRKLLVVGDAFGHGFIGHGFGALAVAFAEITD